MVVCRRAHCRSLYSCTYAILAHSEALVATPKPLCPHKFKILARASFLRQYIREILLFHYVVGYLIELFMCKRRGCLPRAFRHLSLDVNWHFLADKQTECIGLTWKDVWRSGLAFSLSVLFQSKYFDPSWHFLSFEVITLKMGLTAQQYCTFYEINVIKILDTQGVTGTDILRDVCNDSLSDTTINLRVLYWWPQSAAGNQSHNDPHRTGRVCKPQIPTTTSPQGHTFTQMTL